MAPTGPLPLRGLVHDLVERPVDRVAVLVPACRVRFRARFGSVHGDEPEVAPVRARLPSSLGPSSLAGDGGALDSAVPFPSVPQESHVGTRRRRLAQHGEDMVVVPLHDRQGPDRPQGRLRRWGPRSQTDHRFPRRAALAFRVRMARVIDRFGCRIVEPPRGPPGPRRRRALSSGNMRAGWGGLEQSSVPVMPTSTPNSGRRVAASLHGTYGGPLRRETRAAGRTAP